MTTSTPRDSGERKLTAEEFERQYAERSSTTVEWLRRYHVVLPCDCGGDVCEGWRMVSHQQARDIADPGKPWMR